MRSPLHLFLILCFGSVSRVPGFLHFTIEFTQGWNGDLHKAKLPDGFVIDYVRVYLARSHLA